MAGGGDCLVSAPRQAGPSGDGRFANGKGRHEGESGFGGAPAGGDCQAKKRLAVTFPGEEILLGGWGVSL